MALDSDIATAIEAALVTAGISAIVQTTLSQRTTKVPYIGVNTDGTGPNIPSDLTSDFYRIELPFVVEVIGSDADNSDALLHVVEKAILGISLDSGWFEFESQTKMEITKKYQQYKQGKKIYYTDLSL